MRYHAWKQNLTRKCSDDPSDKPEGTEACACMCAFTMSEMFRDEGIIEDDSEVIEYMCASKNDTVTERLPMAPALIAREQKCDKGFQKRPKDDPNYRTMQLEDQELITFQGKILVPKRLQGRIVAWYHEYLSHPGGTQLYKTINQTLTWKSLKAECVHYSKTCTTCQEFEKTTKKWESYHLRRLNLQYRGNESTLI